MSLTSASKPLHRVFSSLDFDVSFWQYAYKRATKKSCALHPFLADPSLAEEPPIELGLCVSNVPNLSNVPNGSNGSNGSHGSNGSNGFNKGSNHRKRPNSIDGSINHKGSNRLDRSNSYRESNRSRRSNSYRESNRSRRSNSSNAPTNYASPNSPNSPSGVFQSEFIVVSNTHCFRWRLKYLQDIELPRCVEDAFPLLLHPLVSKLPSFESRYLCELRRCVAFASKPSERTSLW